MAGISTIVLSKCSLYKTCPAQVEKVSSYIFHNKSRLNRVGVCNKVWKQGVPNLLEKWRNLWRWSIMKMVVSHKIWTPLDHLPEMKQCRPKFGPVVYLEGFPRFLETTQGPSVQQRTMYCSLTPGIMGH